MTDYDRADYKGKMSQVESNPLAQDVVKSSNQGCGNVEMSNRV
jgi:hypothetical protein